MSNKTTLPPHLTAPANGFSPEFHRLFDPTPVSTPTPSAAATPPTTRAVTPPRPRVGLAQKALERTLLTIVEGANQATRSMTAPVSKAMAWKQADAAKADASPGTQNPIGWKAAWERAKEVLSNPAQTKKDALANAHQHSKSVLPQVNVIKQTADKILATADANSQLIRPKLSMPELAAAKVIGMGPELLLSGPSKARVVANRVVSAVQNYGQNQSIAGAIGELITPGKLGNSVVGNIATNLIVDTLAGLGVTEPPPR